MVSDSHQGGKNDLTGPELGKIVRRMFRDVDHVGKLEIGNKNYMLPVVYSIWQCNQLICRFQIYILGTSLAVQWLTLHASIAGGTGSIPARELRSCILCGMAKKEKKKTF